MTAFMADLLIKLTLLLALGLVLTRALRAKAPAFRHTVLFATLASALILPATMVLLPRWDMALLPQDSAARRPSASEQTATEAPRLVKLRFATESPATDRAADTKSHKAPTGSAPVTAAPHASTLFTSPLYALPFAWALGFLCVLAWLTVGRLSLGRIAKTAWPLGDREWTAILNEERRDAGVATPVLLSSSPVVSTPLTWGWKNPVILLPEDACDWTDEHRRIVLRHELAHIARQDSLSQLVAGLTCALYWFHPLVWAAERRMRAECERACDDRVVSMGTPAADYAAHLLEVARSARAFGAAGFLSVAMARPSQLEGRLLAVLSESRQRVSVSRSARRTVALLSALILVPLAAFRAVPRAEASARTPSPAITRMRAEPSSAALIHAAPIVGAPRLGVDSTFHLSAPVQSGGTLTLDLKTGGAIVVTGWDRSEVSVQARLAGRDWRETEVRLDPADGGARLESDFTTFSNSRSSRHRFEIYVPRKFNVHVRSSGGSIEISGVDGTFSGESGGGDIDIRNASGDVALATGGGDIRVEDSHLDGTVSTGGGTVRIERVSGKLSGSSGGGTVTYIGSTTTAKSDQGLGARAGYGAAGAAAGSSAGSGYSYASSGITMTTGGGDISVPQAPEGAHVTTGGGHVRIGPSNGEVYAQTGGGPIDVGPATGSVDATTGAGDVTIRLEGADNHSVRVSSGSGEVTLDVPANLNATLDLETAYTNNYRRKTRINSDFPVSPTETTTWDDAHGTPRKYVRVRQTIGRGGPVIRIRTVNGDINLRRR